MYYNSLSNTYFGHDGKLEWHGWRDVPWVSVGDGPLSSRPFTLVRPAHFYSRTVDRWIDLPDGFSTDFFSIPRPWRWYFQTMGPGRTAALLHDFLVEDRPDWCDTHLASAIFMEALTLAKIGGWRVQAFGWATEHYGPQFSKKYPYNT